MISTSEAQTLAMRASAEWPQIAGTPELIMHRENTVFRVQTAQGPFALRLHRQFYHSENTLRSELQFMAMLASAGMQVPIPLAARSSDLLHALPTAEGTRFFSMLSWLPGTPLGKSGQSLSMDATQRRHVFRTLGHDMAQLHTLADGWLPPADFERPRWDAAGLVGDRPVWGPFWKTNTSDHDKARLEAAQKAIADHLASLTDHKPDYGLIHADLVRENVLVNGLRLSFIDFDDCGFGFRLFDIATALLKNIDEPDFSALQDCLLQGYSGVRALPGQTEIHLKWFMAIRALTYLGWANDRRSEPGMVDRSARFLATSFRMLQAIGL